jgi:PKHD-type hydroxylase
MLLHIKNAIGENQLAAVRSALSRGTFERTGSDGSDRESLRWSGPDDVMNATMHTLVTALQNHPQFQAAACPAAFVTPVFYRYEIGMGDADHIAPAMFGDSPIRCDIAATVCLDDADSYEGGELVIGEGAVSTRWKGDAGDCLLHPPGEVCRVEPVRRGVRSVAVLWVESQVASAERRRILFDLVRVLELADDQSLTGPHVETLRRSYFNLLRLWT